MSDFQTALFGTFSKRPKEPEKPVAPAAPPEKPEAKPDLWTAAEAQRIFSPNSPPAVKPPPAPPAGGGTSGSLGIEGQPWGKPEAQRA